MPKTDPRKAERSVYVPPTWPLNLAIVLALGFAFSGLNAIFTEPSWWFVVAGFIGAVTFAVAAVRTLTRWWGWPSIAGVVVLLICLTFSFAPTQSLLGFIPTADVMVKFTELVADGFASISNQGVPADATTGIVFLLAAGAGLLTIVTDAIAITAKRPALVGIPLVVLLAVPTIFEPSEADPWIFFLTAAAYLLLLYLGIGEARTGGAVGVAAAALVVALVVPIVAPTVTPDQDEASNGTGFTIGINTFIALGENLRRPNPSRVLEYTTTSTDGQYLTVSSIDNFSGSQWKPAGPSNDGDGEGLLDIGPIPGLDREIDRDTDTTNVEIFNMGGRYAPVPYAPSRVIGLSEDWSFNPESLTITSAGDSARGAEYEVRSVRATPTVQQLRAAGPPPEGFDRYLTVPDELDPAVVETAQQVVDEADATTPFDQAVALQSYFTDGTFAYSEEAPVEEGYDGTSAEVVGRFLEAKSGYCVHFSSAMAVMARSLGIPARIAVGFTPGEYVVGNNDDDEEPYYLVTTANLHAWPELYFDTVGWVRFEPTVGRGDIPTFDDEDRSEAPSASPSPSASASASARPSASASASASPSAAPDSGFDFGSVLVAAVTVGALTIGAVVVLLLPLLPALVRVVRRARRYWRVWRHRSASEAWVELSDTAIDLGWKSAATTPKEFEDLVRTGMPDKATAALERLRAAIEFSAYSRSPEPSSIADVRLVRRAMGAASSRNDRMRARFSPRSVVLRGLRRR